MTKYNSKLTEGQAFSAAGYAQVEEEEETSQIQSFHHQHPQQHIPNRVHIKQNYVKLYSNLGKKKRNKKNSHIFKETKSDAAYSNYILGDHF